MQDAYANVSFRRSGSSGLDAVAVFRGPVISTLRAALVSPALLAAVKHDFATGGGRPGADRKHMG